MKVKLLTKEIEKRLPRLYATDGMRGKQEVVAKYFTPDGSWAWLAVEGERTEDGDVMFFGLVQGHEEELGYFSLNELSRIRGPWGLPIERDRHFGKKTLEEAAPKFCERLWGQL